MCNVFYFKCCNFCRICCNFHHHMLFCFLLSPLCFIDVWLMLFSYWKWQVFLASSTLLSFGAYIHFHQSVKSFSKVELTILDSICFENDESDCCWWFIYSVATEYEAEIWKIVQCEERVWIWMGIGMKSSIRLNFRKNKNFFLIYFFLQMFIIFQIVRILNVHQFKDFLNMLKLFAVIFIFEIFFKLIFIFFRMWLN